MTIVVNFLSIMFLVPFHDQHLSDQINVDNNLNQTLRKTASHMIDTLTIIIKFSFMFRISSSIDTIFAMSTCITSFMK